MEVVAPDLIGSDDEYPGCFVRKQPSTDAETYRMLRAMHVNEVEGLRYGGVDPEITRRIAEAGMANGCERRCSKEWTPVARARARVRCDPPTLETLTGIVTTLHERVRHTNVPDGESDRSTKVASAVAAYNAKSAAEPIPSLRSIEGGLAFDLRPWPAAKTTTVTVMLGRAASSGMEVTIDAPELDEQFSTAVILDDFLRSHPAVRSIRWFTESEWAENGSSGRPFPY